MKKSIVKKMIAGAIASTMILGMAACGGDESQTSGNASDNASNSVSSSVSNNTSSSASDSVASSSVAVEPTEEPKPEPLSITVSLPSDNEHVEANELYDRLVQEINEYTNMNITYKWKNRTDYFEQVDLDIIAGNVADVMVINRTATFLEACDEGLFWDLTEYVDDYDNLATIPDMTIESASYNGRLFAIPSSRVLARNGFGYRLDWLNNLGLKEPTDWESFKNMLYAFTYSDPDGNGVDDTVGLAVDQWTGMWDIMKAWFGCPYVWGLDENGDLIHESQTKEYKEAWAAFRDLYSLGVINSGANGVTYWEELTPGAIRKSLLQAGTAGCGVQVLGDMRKVQQYFENQGITTTDNIIFTLANYVDCGYGPKVQTNGGVGNLFAISTKNVKTEEQLKQVLGYLNDLCDGEILNMVDYGWEGVTYDLDENGYIVMYDAETLAAKGTNSSFRDGFNQILAYFTAEENARPYIVEPANTPIVAMEQALNLSGQQYVVGNLGVSYVSETYAENGTALDTLLEEAEMDYLTGVIDEAAFDAVIKQWLTAGGEQLTKEMNELYHAAGN